MVTPVKRDDLDNYVYVCGGEESEGGFGASPTAAGMLVQRNLITNLTELGARK